MIKNFSIYKHTNLINGKVYFGITCQFPSKRWKNGLGYKHNKYFYNDIKEYGWNNFSHEILYENLSNEEALDIETQLIIKNKSYMKEYGYNIIKETNNPLSYKCANNKDKTLEEIFGKDKANKIKSKISKSNAGKNDWTSQLKVSQETKNKISNSLKEYYSTHSKKKPSNSQKVICINDNMIYNSLSECSKVYHIPVSDISKICKGILKQSKGYFFQFIDRIDNTVGKRKVMCIETGQIFESLKDCANYFNTNSSLICACCKGRRKRIKGHTFKYI